VCLFVVFIFDCTRALHVEEEVSVWLEK